MSYFKHKGFFCVVLIIEQNNSSLKDTIMNNQTKLVVGVLAGAAAIAAVGLLFSTDKGSEIREEVTDYLADLVKTVKKKAEETADNLAELKASALKSAKSSINGKVNDVAEAVGN